MSVWLPPGGTELADDQHDALGHVLSENLTPDDQTAMFELYERFAASRAPLPAHYYLSMLGTHPDHRGRGVGQGLLAADLARAGTPNRHRPTWSHRTRVTTTATSAWVIAQSAASRPCGTTRGSQPCGAMSEVDNSPYLPIGTRCVVGSDVPCVHGDDQRTMRSCRATIERSQSRPLPGSALCQTFQMTGRSAFSGGDQRYLRDVQYGTGAKLDARSYLHRTFSDITRSACSVRGRADRLVASWLGVGVWMRNRKVLGQR